MISINFRNAALFVLLFSAIFFFSACDKESPSESSSTENFNSSDYALLDFEDAMNSIQGGTIEQDYQVSLPFPGDNGFVRGQGSEQPGRHLRSILWLLELTEEQSASVRTFVTESNTCLRTSFEEFRTAVAPILRTANEQRQIIIQQFRNGEITNEEAYFTLQKLREDTHTAIENDPGVQAAKQAICDCKLNVLENMGSILDEAQLIIWNDWFSNLSGPCFE